MDLRAKIISATLKLAETTRWQEITIENIAEKANTKPALLKKEFPTKLHILDAYSRQVDVETAKSVERIELTGSVRDQLFELLMARFDILNKNKVAIGLIYNETIPSDPVAGARGMASLFCSMNMIRKTIGINDRIPLNHIKTKVLCLVFMKSFLVWLEDGSSDMSKTMARLDRDLSKIERLQKLLLG